MQTSRGARLRNMPRYILRPLPLWLCNPLLQRIIHHVAARQPQLFRRLGAHCHKSFLIESENLPFVLLLRPDPARLTLQAFRFQHGLDYQARISGSFMQLLRLLDSRGDSDATFFSRDIAVEGDTEAIVCLRNALDDVEGSIAGDIAAMFGPLGRRGLNLLRHVEV